MGGGCGQALQARSDNESFSFVVAQLMFPAFDRQISIPFELDWPFRLGMTVKQTEDGKSMAERRCDTTKPAGLNFISPKTEKKTDIGIENDSCLFHVTLLHSFDVGRRRGRPIHIEIRTPSLANTSRISEPTIALFKSYL